MAIIRPEDAFAPSVIKMLSAPPTAEEIQAALDGGWVESVPGFVRYRDKRCLAFCDEEGKLKRLPINRLASQLWYEQMSADAAEGLDYLVGPIVIVAGGKKFLTSL